MPSGRPRISTADRHRLFELHSRVCHLCGCEIQVPHERWEVEHVVPRGLIGAAADTDANMRPAHVRCHKGKTLLDAGAIAKAKRRAAKDVGAFRSARPIPGGRFDTLKRRMDGRVVRRDGGDARG